MGPRLFMVLVLSVQAILAWPGGRAVTQVGFPLAATASTAAPESCGGDCCCQPAACPCMHAPTPDERSRPAPAVPSRSDSRDLPTVLPGSIDTLLLGIEADLSRKRPTVVAETRRPAGDLSRRVQQLQCVWRT